MTSGRAHRQIEFGYHLPCEFIVSAQFRWASDSRATHHGTATVGDEQRGSLAWTL